VCSLQDNGPKKFAEGQDTYSDFFASLSWERDRVIRGGWVFRLESARDDPTCDLRENCFRLHKTKQLIDEYQNYLSREPDFRPKNKFELGIWEGGSVAFWSECFRPQMHVAVDILQKADTEYFKSYVRSREPAQHVKTYWGVDQADRFRLKQIVESEFNSPLDLVIDDASHTYKATKTSFETLFPMLRPGGIYVIEDWAWVHWKEFVEPPNGRRR